MWFSNYTFSTALRYGSYQQLDKYTNRQIGKCEHMPVESIMAAPVDFTQT